jgi:LacI family repressor for deo operon, udp, cdd, tsx, nupC, and nupG
MGRPTEAGGSRDKSVAAGRSPGPPGADVVRGPGRRPTAQDVAERAGVSQASVSLAFSSAMSTRVSGATRDRIQRVAAELGYQPQAIGRQLRDGRTGLLLLLVPDVRAPFFARVLAGAHDEAVRQGLSVVLGAGWSAQEVATSVGSGLFDAVVMCSPDDTLAELPLPRVPVVLLDADPSTAHGIANRATVEMDVVGGMTAAVEHLIGLGHRRLGRIRSTYPAYTFRARQGAFERASRGLRIDQVGTDLRGGLESAVRAADELLSQHDRPAAVVCDDDVLAAGVYHSAARRGMSVPEDVSVVGMDNTQSAGLVWPPLTTVDLPGEELGALGIRLSRQLPDGPATGHVIPTELIVRGSTCSA